jgi:hypothetical protein
MPNSTVLTPSGALEGGVQLEVLTVVPCRGIARRLATTAGARENGRGSLVEHWRTFGLPTYAQFDNDSIFTGTHRWPDREVVGPGLALACGHPGAVVGPLWVTRVVGHLATCVTGRCRGDSAFVLLATSMPRSG